MGSHIIDGEFQSDKYPTCPRGKVPLSVRDATAQDLLWAYAQRRRAVDPEFADDLETALTSAGYRTPELPPRPKNREVGLGAPSKWEVRLLAIGFVLACAFLGAWIAR